MPAKPSHFDELGAGDQRQGGSDHPKQRLPRGEAYAVVRRDGHLREPGLVRRVGNGSGEKQHLQDDE